MMYIYLHSPSIAYYNHPSHLDSSWLLHLEIHLLLDLSRRSRGPPTVQPNRRLRRCNPNPNPNLSLNLRHSSYSSSNNNSNHFPTL